MAPLATNLRRDLERKIIDARKTAERGARSAINALTVSDAKTGRHLDATGRDLRNRLRAHARQLGDKRSAKGEQAIERLVRECAYEHWHRMLFARFLAENDLLVEPESGVSVSLEDVEELAREQGVKPWPLAASFAQRMLPKVFRADDPVLAIDLPTEAVLRLESLLKELPHDVFTCDDALGWTYQFWQSAEKDAVNDRVNSGEKITGETLPAVTQLFTEHYMVLFLLHNTIGAWHAGKVLSDTQRESVASEQALRDAVCLDPLGGYDFECLRFVRESKEGVEPEEAKGHWRPAAGTYDGWPKAAAKLRVLDPCCGSGHFLVAAFDLLVRLRIAEEGLATEDAIRAVLADNLFGLELDLRCTQIAAFNLALAAWKLAGKPIDLPPMHLACCGIGPQSTREDWLNIAEAKLAHERPDVREAIRRGLTHMHELFSDAPELGSLIDPNELPAEGFAADFETLRPVLETVLEAKEVDEDTHERAVAAHGMAKAAAILSGRRSDGDDGYTLVTTNVPYLGRGSQSDLLKAFGDANYKDAKADLATMFVARMLCWVGRDEHAGTVAAVTPLNWLFLSSYKKLRERLLKERSWEMVARLGPGAFETIGGHVVNVALLGITGAKARKDHVMAVVDASAASSPSDKATLLRGATTQGDIKLLPQAGQLENPESRVLMVVLGELESLSDYAIVSEGLHTGDYPRFGRKHWELDGISNGWSLQQGGSGDDDGAGGCEHVLFWEGGDGALIEFVRTRLDSEVVTMWIKGEEVWGKRGVAVGTMSGLRHSLYTGALFTHGIVGIVANDEAHSAAVLAYAESPEFRENIRTLDQKVCVARAAFEKIPFDVARWQVVAAEKYPFGLPEPQSDDPTQWLFHGNPAHSDSHATLQVGVARLVGYRWPAELDADMRLAREARDLVNKCDELLDLADDDGIVCLSPVRGEGSADDRLRRLLAAAFGSQWNATKERELLRAAGEAFNKGKAAGSLDAWLRERFFAEHCALFHHRPFVWHIWDGRKDGFHALVNYHKLAEGDGRGRKLLESLTYSYLGDWIKRQQDGVKSGESGAEARLAAAMELKEELEKILAGEPPYDIFVRWKPLHEQPIGWEPDINDGVRLNIRPFMSATLSKGKKGAGVLRWKPNIKWTKDRGKEPQKLRPREDFPWFWGWNEKRAEHAIDFGSGLKDAAPAGRDFDGNRWNDLHYTNAAKQAAHDRAAIEAAT